MNVLNEYFDFENEIQDCLLSLLQGDETLERGKAVTGRTGFFVADFYLPKGCQPLSLPSPTYVECKLRLRNESLRIIRRTYDSILQSEEKCSLLIICAEDITIRGAFEAIFPLSEVSEKVKIRTLQELQDIQKPDSSQRIHTQAKRPTTLESAKETFKQNNCTLFLGAGVSMPLEMPGWNKLLQGLLKQDNGKPFEYINDANIEAIQESISESAIVAGHYIIDGFRNAVRKELSQGGHRNADNKKDEKRNQDIEEDVKEEIRKRMRDTLYKKSKKTSDLIKAIARLAKTDHVKQVITYNYDDILNQELKDHFYTISQNDYCGQTKKPIYHVHGLIPEEGRNSGLPVLSETEYHKLYSNMHHWANVVQLNVLYSTVCLFIDFSMTDPNQRRLLDLAKSQKIKEEDPKPKHYVFLKRQALRGKVVKEVNEEHCKEIESMMTDFNLNVI